MIARPRANPTHRPRYNVSLATIWSWHMDSRHPVSLTEIAHTLGVSRVALRKRLINHGYLPRCDDKPRDERGHYMKVLPIRPEVFYERSRVYRIECGAEGIEESRTLVKSFMFENMAQDFALRKNIDCLDDAIFVVVTEKVVVAR